VPESLNQVRCSANRLGPCGERKFKGFAEGAGFAGIKTARTSHEKVDPEAEIFGSA
jgi:hypothetical protein